MFIEKRKNIIVKQDQPDCIVELGPGVGKKTIILGKGESVNELGTIPDNGEFLIIGINDVYKKYPVLHHLFYFDHVTYSENKKQFDELLNRGTSIWTAVRNPRNPEHKRVLVAGSYGWQPGKFFHSFTSAYFCLQIAYALGSREIYLAGIDLCLPSSGDYWDGTSAREKSTYINHLQKMRKGFEIAATEQAQFGFRVFRISNTSSLECFEIRRPFE